MQAPPKRAAFESTQDEQAALLLFPELLQAEQVAGHDKQA
jgi:hypothetical protein